MLLRWFFSFLVIVTAPHVVLHPASQYLSGFAEGLWSVRMEQTWGCQGAIARYETRGVDTQSQWLGTYYLGESAGLQLKAILQDDLKDHPFFNGEIYHVYSLLFAFVPLCVLALVYFLSAKFTKEAVASPEPSSPGRPISKRDIEYWDMVHSYSVDLRRLKMALDKKDEQLRSTWAMLRQYWAHNKRLAALREVADENRRRDREPSRANDELRRNVDQLKRELREAQDKLTRAEDESARRSDSLREEVADLTKRLAASEERVANALSESVALRIELRAQTDKTAAAEQRQFEAERRLADAQDRNRNEGAQAQGLAALAARYDALRGSYDKLSEHCRALEAVNNAMEIVKQERDAAAGRIVALQAELEATKSRADEAFAACQNALEEARGSETALRQSLQAVESAFSERCRKIELEALANARSQADCICARTTGSRTSSWDGAPRRREEPPESPGDGRDRQGTRTPAGTVRSSQGQHSGDPQAPDWRHGEHPNCPGELRGHRRPAALRDRLPQEADRGAQEGRSGPDG